MKDYVDFLDSQFANNNSFRIRQLSCTLSEKDSKTDECCSHNACSTRREFLRIPLIDGYGNIFNFYFRSYPFEFLKLVEVIFSITLCMLVKPLQI